MSPPTHGTACTLPPGPEAHCTYGDDPRPLCRTQAKCSYFATWVVTAPSTGCSDPPLDVSCPSSPPANGAVCTGSEDCWYGDGTHCWCSGCLGGSGYPICQVVNPPQFACSTPPSGCPTVMPHAGAACSNEGLRCGPSCELDIRCQSGVWVWATGQCPVCASPDTPIATPDGERPIASLRVGDLVYSVEEGLTVVVPLVRVGSTPVVDHHVMRVVLDDGPVLEISPGHPTADGRLFSDLAAGAWLDASHRVRDAELVPYVHGQTYDILPGSSTGTYYAAGVLIGSTLSAE